MSNAKRAIMVPVMTLAVCAIAMVGLGFALTTSVTSNSNTVEKLMVDLDDDYAALKGQADPDNEDVNGLFSIGVETVKMTATAAKSENTTTYSATIDSTMIVVTKTDSTYTVKIGETTYSGDDVKAKSVENTTVVTCIVGNITYETVIPSSGNATTSAITKTITGGSAFIKVFGNKDVKTLTVSNNSAVDVVFTLYTVTYENDKITNITAYSTATLTSSDSESPYSADFTNKPITNTTYLVAITQIGGANGYNISYSVDNSGAIIPTISGTLNMTTTTYNLTFTAKSTA